MKKNVNKFVNCGFEFTAAQHKGKKLSDNLSFGWDNTRLYLDNTKSLKEYKWISDRFEADDCGCEVSTPIVKNSSDVTRYFNEFNNFTKANNLTFKISNSNDCLGGCHIHLSLSKFRNPKDKKLFLQNIGVFLTNYPQLNWGFNDLEDNINANTLFYKSGSGIFNDYEFRNFSNHPYPYYAYMHNPIKVSLYKKYALRYNSDYNTIELRIFCMPETLKQHLLHYDVAMAIYKYCENITKNGKLMKLELDENFSFKLDESLGRFKQCMDIIKIDKTRVTKMLKNIKTRYEWDGYKGAKYLL